MIKKIYFLLIVTLYPGSIAAWAGTTGTPNINTNTGNIAKSHTQANSPSPLKTSTPSETGESFYQAIKAKDKAAFKQLMSKDSMEILNAAAQEQKMTFDEMLDKQFFANSRVTSALQQRNEKITGDKATTEMLDGKGKWILMNFVKEGGTWKVSLE